MNAEDRERAVSRALKECKAPWETPHVKYDAEEPALYMAAGLLSSSCCSSRNARFFGSLVRAKPIADAEAAKECVRRCRRPGVLFVGGGPMTFCGFKEELGELIRRAAATVWINDDYAIEIPLCNGDATSPIHSACRDAYADGKRYWVWSIMEHRVAKVAGDYTRFYPMDVNMLGWDGDAFEKAWLEREFDRAIDATPRPCVGYYGSWRKGREAQFRKYLRPAGEADKLVVWSLSSDAYLFKQACRAELRKERCTPEDVAQLCKLSVYMQDGYGDRHPAFASTRAYEMACAGLPFVIAEESRSALERVGFDAPDDWYVRDGDAVVVALDRSAQLAHSHRRWWHARSVTKRLSETCAVALDRVSRVVRYEVWR